MEYEYFKITKNYTDELLHSYKRSSSNPPMFGAPSEEVKQFDRSYKITVKPEADRGIAFHKY